MRMLIDILHPAHVHFFRNAIAEWRHRGHEVRILSRKKDVATELLDAYGLQHKVISTQKPGRLQLAGELAHRIHATQKVIQHYRPDIMLGLMGPSIAVAGKLTGVPTVVFYDNETTHNLNKIVSKLTDAWISPRGFEYNYGAKHIRYNGYHELAYLHPNRFTPDIGCLQQYGINADKPYSILRFVAWESIHDTGESGFDLAGRRKAIEKLSRIGAVYISSEKPLPAEFESYRLNLPVENIHHALSFATVVAGESSTMASEAACLGTHAVFLSKSGRGVNKEQEERYGLVNNFNEGRQKAALAHLENLAQRGPEEIKREAGARRDVMLADVVDVTQFVVDYVQQYDCSSELAAA
ncbi:DUF354 domain-containing protein [Hyphococcus sp.]|uniref:DUF354 domain-containing protein n=1 Tax=Hyphococcus sp. TaxID=2038636 RepID=UPI003CCBEADD